MPGPPSLPCSFARGKGRKSPTSPCYTHPPPPFLLSAEAEAEEEEEKEELPEVRGGGGGGENYARQKSLHDDVPQTFLKKTEELLKDAVIYIFTNTKYHRNTFERGKTRRHQHLYL